MATVLGERQFSMIESNARSIAANKRRTTNKHQWTPMKTGICIRVYSCAFVVKIEIRKISRQGAKLAKKRRTSLASLASLREAIFSCPADGHSQHETGGRTNVSGRARALRFPSPKLGSANCTGRLAPCRFDSTGNWFSH